jgi:long-chain acyl-CoA synthetase
MYRFTSVTSTASDAPLCNNADQGSGARQPVLSEGLPTTSPPTAAPTAADRPWLRFYGRVPATIDYPRVTLYEAVAATARRVPDSIAWDFFGTSASYRELLRSIDACADALAALGLRRGDRLLVSMPTAPPGIVAFYAANKLGAVCALIHPLSTAPEIEHCLDASGARIALTLDAFYGALTRARPRQPLAHIVLACLGDDLPPAKRLGFWLAKGRKIPRVPDDPRVRWWAKLMATAHAPAAPAPSRPDDPAAILFSGGTTGSPKAILLSHRNFVAEGMQAAAWGGIAAGNAILAILPIFHGFGLGVCVNAMLMAGGMAILVPQFSAKTVAKLIRTKRPSILVGVPTLFDALTRERSLARVDLSCLRTCFCGADTLTRPVKERFERLVAERGGNVRLLEGYGLTEAVTAIMAMPQTEYREGSIGVPFPDTDAMICRLGTTEAVPHGEEGEICVAGPAVMLGYLDDPEATANALKVHADGRTWLHTGDLGRRDADGFFYFTVRAKRMIKSSGFNVYPAQVEAVLLEHRRVAEACVIGVPDESQGERVAAVVVLKDRAHESDATARELIAFCRERLIKWSCPRQIEFRAELPKTRIGKVDFKALAAEHAARRRSESA